MLSVLFVLTAQRCAELYANPLPKSVMTIPETEDGGFSVVFNNTKEKFDGVEPMQAMCYWGGLPAIYFGPNGGAGAVSQNVNEDALQTWLADQIEDKEFVENVTADMTKLEPSP